MIKISEPAVINSVQLLTFASLTGIVLVLSVIGILMLPGLFWKPFIYESKIIKNVWSNKLSRIIVIFIIPMICTYLSLFIHLANQNEFKIIKYGWVFKYEWVILFLIILPILLYIWGLLRIWGRLKSKAQKNIEKKFLIKYKTQKNFEERFSIKYKAQQVTWKHFSLDYVKCMALAYVGSFISTFPIVLLIVEVFLDNYKEDIKSLATGCLYLIIFVVISNIIAITQPESANSTYVFFTVGLVLFLFITVLTNTPSTVPQAIMKTYKLGNINASSIIVDKQSCNTINKSMEFYKVKDSSKENEILYFPIKNESCIIPNVHILSKLGTEAYIEFNGINIEIENKENNTIKEYKTMRFVIPSSNIITYNLIR